jgi:putative N6-adenine-specific DNA methylase
MANAFEKRVKRQVVARSHEFFAVAMPGSEPLCLEEIQPLLGDEAAPRIVEGGIAFDGKLADGYCANLHLRLATRLLMRIGVFRADRFKGLERHLGDFPWELYLPPAAPPEVNVTVHQCRLYHSDAIAQRAAGAISQRLAAHAASPATGAESDQAQTIFIRGIKDRFTLSIDSSGAPLYRRGLKTQGGRAPIRETLAAAILRQAGFTGREVLADPMCGSGTFSLEGAMMAARIPAGWFRDFAFMDWPGFRPGQWRHLRRKAEAQILMPAEPAIHAADTDAKALEKLSRRLSASGLDRAVRAGRSDFFELDPQSLTKNPGLVVINPPYGRRIGAAGGSDDFFDKICRRLEQAWHGWRCALIAPGRQAARHAPAGMTRAPLHHGGLHLTLLTGTL